MTYTVYSLDLGLETREQAIDFGRRYAEALEKAFVDAGLEIEVRTEERMSGGISFRDHGSDLERQVSEIADSLWEKMLASV